MPERKASPVSAIGFVTKVIDLPESGPAGTISIEIRKVHPAELLAKIGNMPALAAGPEAKKDASEVLRLITASREPIAAVAELVIYDPPFSFGPAPEDGKAWWGHLSWANQMAVFNEGMAFAGLRSEVKEGTDAAAAHSAARFPGQADRPQAGRNGVRGGSRGRGEGARRGAAPNARSRA